MKIEVIEKKREEAKETPFIVGGVYRFKDGTYRLLFDGDEGRYRMYDVETGEVTWGEDSRQTYTELIECGTYTYVPNARLVIDEND